VTGRGSRWLAAAALFALVGVTISSWRGQDRLAARADASERALQIVIAQQRQLAASLEVAMARRPTPSTASTVCAPAQAVVGASATHSDALPEPAAPTPLLEEPGVVQARAAAWSAVEGVLARGEWTEEDRAHHGPLFRSLDDAERMRILTTLADAMNRGELAPSVADFL